MTCRRPIGHWRTWRDQIKGWFLSFHKVPCFESTLVGAQNTQRSDDGPIWGTNQLSQRTSCSLYISRFDHPSRLPPTAKDSQSGRDDLPATGPKKQTLYHLCDGLPRVGKSTSVSFISGNEDLLIGPSSDPNRVIRSLSACQLIEA